MVQKRIRWTIPSDWGGRGQNNSLFSINSQTVPNTSVCIHTKLPGEVVLVPLQNRKQRHEETPNQEAPLFKL